MLNISRYFLTISGIPSTENTVAGCFPLYILIETEVPYSIKEIENAKRDKYLVSPDSSIMYYNMPTHYWMYYLYIANYHYFINHLG